MMFSQVYRLPTMSRSGLLRVLPLMSASSSVPKAGMSYRRRNHYIKDGSNETNISDEVRDLIRNQKTAENIDDWKRGPGIQDPIVYSMKDPDDIDDDQTPDMVYYPHKGEEIATDYKPSPVLLVKRVKPLAFQPFWHKEACEKLGLGEFSPLEKVVAVPNIPSMCYKLFAIKHLIEIIPLKFPMGFPEDEEFDPAACRITHKGEFLYDPKLKVDETAMKPQMPMKITKKDISYEGQKHWYRPWNSPLGNSNYDRDSSTVNPGLSNRKTDSTYVAKFKD